MTPVELPARYKIFIVDDHPLVREWLGSLIDQQKDLQLCGHAGNVSDAMKGITATRPDVVIVDLSLGESSGLELIKNLQTMIVAPKTVVLTMHDETFYAERALRAGASGYVMKQESTGRIIEAIRRVMAGELFVAEKLAVQLAGKFVSKGGSADTSSPVERLSDRELEVFRMIGQGLENRRIAEIMNVSLKTVQAYCARIKEKLAIDNATELLRAAVRWGDKERGV
jgi:DNA-binding NarL/FixJ family response regulator